MTLTMKVSTSGVRLQGLVFLTGESQISSLTAPLLHSSFPFFSRAKLKYPVIFTSVLAAIPSSTFILAGDQGSNVTISVNVPSNAPNDDIFFHLSAPAGQAWVGFGFGTEMNDALIFVAYSSRSGNNVTISPRIGSGHDEPKYTHAVDVKVLDGSFVNNETYNINAQCTGCRSWPLASGRRGTIDIKSVAQPMIYAIGDASPFLQTDSQEATIRQHMAYGKFTIDLKAATGDAGVPSNTTTETGVNHSEDSGDSRLGTVFHGLIMSACFVILFPIGSLLIRVPFRLAFYLHLLWQICTVVGVVVGLALGIYISVRNNINPRLNSVHQGLGLTVVLLVVLVQPTLGFLHHRTFKRTTSPTLLGKTHRFFGPAVIILGIIDGALGLHFADNNGKLPAYFGFVIFIAIICTLAQWVFRRKNMRKNAMNSVAASNFREGQQAGYGDVPLQNYYEAQRNGDESVNASQVSFAQAQQPPPKYVNAMPRNEESRMS